MNQDIKEKKLPETIMVSHGSVEHSLKNRLECVPCIRAEIEFLQAVEQGGGLSKLIDYLSEKEKV